ncbi:MAG: glycosyltransferase [Bauldia sp.]|nr:glycosyltransferase [Bauldia sp.]
MQVFFTIASANYLASVRTLMQSLRKAYPDAPRYLFAVEPYAPTMRSDEAEVVAASDIGIPDFSRRAFGYSVLEFNTAVKPWCFTWLAQKYPKARITYFDPDIMVFRKLSHVDRALADGAAMVLTPHITEPLDSGFTPDDLSILKSGTYNLGFLALRADARGIPAFLKWWADKLRYDAVVDIAANKFTDQRWMDLAPSFVAAVNVLRHPGYNVAYWNLPHRPVSRAKQTREWLAAGKPLHFFHFSGYDPDKPEVLSKHQDRLSLATGSSQLRSLFESYRKALVRNGWEHHSTTEYGFSRFAPGRRIHARMRRILLTADRSAADGTPADPFAGNGDWFDERDPAIADEPGLTRIARATWESRADLRNAFHIADPTGRRRFIEWFRQRSPIEEGTDALSIDAADRLLGATQPDVPARPATREWLRPIRGWLNEPYPGPAREARDYLAETRLFPAEGRDIPISRGMLLFLDARDDLVEAFVDEKGIRAEAYVTWVLSTGLGEGLHPAWLPETLFVWLTTEASDDICPLFRLLANCLLDQPFQGFHNTMPATALRWLVATRGRAMAERLALPRALIEMAFDRPASFSVESGADDPPLPWFFEAVREQRPDVAATYDISQVDGRRRLVLWYLLYGAREFGTGIAELGRPLQAWLDFAPTPEQLPNGADLLAAAEGLTRGTEGTPGLAARRLETWFAAIGYTRVRGSAFEDWLSLDSEAAAAAEARPANAYGPLVLIGLVGSPSGRGEDLRMTSAALDAAGVAHDVADLDSLQKDGAKTRCVIVHLNADTAMRDYHALDDGFPNAYRIGYWAWELSRFPTKWLGAFAVYDEIWCSTRFAFDAVRAATDRPVRLMPMAVQLAEIAPRRDRKAFGIPASAYTFLYTFDLSSYVERKNPTAAIRAFIAAFPRSRQDIRLVLKASNAEHYPDAWNRLVEATAGDPRIDLRNATYSREALTRLLNSIDCYVSPHRSEGFGRGPAEAMLLGKPVIVTGYSGNMDFCSERNSLLVDYELVEVGKGQYVDWEEQVWAEVDVAHLARLMAWAADNPAKAAAIGAVARKEAMAAFDKRAAGARILDRIAALGAVSPA